MKMITAIINPHAKSNTKGAEKSIAIAKQHHHEHYHPEDVCCLYFRFVVVLSDVAVNEKAAVGGC